jgi:ketosteroid isomerase-like protein
MIDAESLQREINETVWRPYKAAFENRDGEALNALYGDGVIRVTPAGIDTQDEFKRNNLSTEDPNLTVRLHFWLESRHTNNDTSYEVGMFRIARYSDNQLAEYHYGQFHIVLKKLKGVWKIMQDWDTPLILGHMLNAEDFEKRAPDF